MQEIWRQIPGYNGKYCISNFGNVLSRNFLNTGVDKLLVLKKHHSGYLFVRLCNGSSDDQKNLTVHSLVAKAFIPNPSNKRCVNHIDGNKHNNHVDNLEWVTHKENSQHAIKHGLRDPHKNNHPKGKDTPNSRCVMQYTPEGVFIKTWDCVSDAARAYSMNPCQIINVAKGRNKTAHGYVWKYSD